MIFSLIIIIALVIVVRNTKTRQQGHSQRPQSQQYNQRPQPQPAGQTARQQSYQRPQQTAQQNNQRPPQWTANQQANGRYSRMSNPRQNPQGLVQPVQGTRSAAPERNKARPDDILSRAAANVRENDADELMLRMETGALVTDEPSELIREINDLIIMGYQADISFERDFIAEGIELMNRYEISAEL